MNCSFATRRHPFGHRVRAGAFSLVEIVLALGIMAFAIVGIMGLFPVALRSAQEAQRETHAALIARKIFSDLRSSPAGDTFIATNSNLLASQPRFSLSNASTTSVQYTAEGRPVGPGQDPIFLATVTVSPDTPSDGLARIEATVEAPASAPASSRSKYTFVTLMRQ